LFLILLAASLPAWAWSAEAPDGTAGVVSFRDHTDEQLTALAARWDSLDRHQRRALLTEMKLRMARNGERGEVLHIRTERRYGRLIRQPDGRVIRIETQVVEVRPVEDDDVAQGRKSYGVGFEYRIRRRQETVSATDPTAPGTPPASGASAPTAPSMVLEALEPSPPAPVVQPLPVQRVNDPAP
jgi:hypothetical protein